MNPPSNPTNSGRSFLRELPIVALIILPFIVLAVALPSFPSQVPMHFDAHGDVNRYGSPLELFILPGINVLIAVLLYLIPRLDPKRPISRHRCQPISGFG
jgi:uncharacterized membrane protein